MDWHPEKPHRLTVGGTDFNVAVFYPTGDDGLVIHKTRPMVERVAAVVERVRPRNIVELGIAEGGSTAFLAQLAEPEKLVAIERDGPVEALDTFIAAHGLERSVRTYYGTNQADPALVEICDREFDGPLDLVIDDASHLLEETRASFNMLFPRLRPGGVYVIEDWAWAHVSIEATTVDETAREKFRAAWPTGAPLTVLLFELLMACGSDLVRDISCPKSVIVSDVHVDRWFVEVVRGPAVLDATFDISKSYWEGSVGLLPR